MANEKQVVDSAEKLLIKSSKKKVVTQKSLAVTKLMLKFLITDYYWKAYENQTGLRRNK